jgi:hypothetical protein
MDGQSQNNINNVNETVTISFRCDHVIRLFSLPDDAEEDVVRGKLADIGLGIHKQAYMWWDLSGEKSAVMNIYSAVKSETGFAQVLQESHPYTPMDMDDSAVLEEFNKRSDSHLYLHIYPEEFE